MNRKCRGFHRSGLPPRRVTTTRLRERCRGLGDAGVKHAGADDATGHSAFRHIGAALALSAAALVLGPSLMGSDAGAAAAPKRDPGSAVPKGGHRPRRPLQERREARRVCWIPPGEAKSPLVMCPWGCNLTGTTFAVCRNHCGRGCDNNAPAEPRYSGKLSTDFGATGIARFREPRYQGNRGESRWWDRRRACGGMGRWANLQGCSPSRACHPSRRRTGTPGVRLTSIRLGLQAAPLKTRLLPSNPSGQGGR